MLLPGGDGERAGFRLLSRGRGFGRGISGLTALGTKGEIPPGMLRDRCAPFGTTNWCHPEGRVYGRGISQLTNPKSGADPSSPKLLLRMTKKCNPKSRTSPSVAALVRDDKHKRLVRDDNEGFVILSECEGSRGWVSPESKPRSFGHDTGLRMTNKGKPEIPRSLRSFGTTNINGLFGMTTKALSS